MSNNINDELYERAMEVAAYFEGKLPAQLITEAIDRNDLDTLLRIVQDGESEIARMDYYTNDED